MKNQEIINRITEIYTNHNTFEGVRSGLIDLKRDIVEDNSLGVCMGCGEVYKKQDNFMDICNNSDCINEIR